MTNYDGRTLNIHEKHLYIALPRRSLLEYRRRADKEAREMEEHDANIQTYIKKRVLILLSFRINCNSIIFLPCSYCWRNSSSQTSETEEEDNIVCPKGRFLASVLKNGKQWGVVIRDSLLRRHSLLAE